MACSKWEIYIEDNCQVLLISEIKQEQYIGFYIWQCKCFFLPIGDIVGNLTYKCTYKCIHVCVALV